jgi:Derlin-2/3
VIACCYTVTQDQRGQTAQIYFFNVPAQIMPYCLLLLRLIFDDGFTILMVACTGIFAAHFHDFCTRIYPEFSGGPNLLPTPWWISWIMETPRTRQTNYGTGHMPPRDGQTRSGPLPDSWRNAGPGRRLG